MNPNEFRKTSVPLCREHKTFNKVFGIGANKTGTTSLQAIFALLGLDVSPQEEGERHGVEALKGNLKPLADYIERHDAFQDAPFSLKSTYAQVDALFPGSKFVLTYRDADAWFNSQLSYHKKLMGVPQDQPIPMQALDRFPYLYPGYSKFVSEISWLLRDEGEAELVRDDALLYDPEHYKAQYRARNHEIVRHFAARPDDLLVIDLTRETDTRRIVEFLGLPEALITEIPHLNPTRASTATAPVASRKQAKAPATSVGGDTDGDAQYRVTVAIPAYKASFLDAALRSALEQDFDSFEIVICDDCPTDAVERVVQPYLGRNDGPPVRYYRNEQRLDEQANAGRCIELARGRYIKFLYDDDLLLPGCLTALADVLDRYPDIALASSRRLPIDAQGNPLPDMPATFSPFSYDARLNGPELVSLLADWTLNFIGEPSTVMLRREHVLPVARHQYSLNGKPVAWLGDLTMHVNLLRKGDLALLAAPLSCLRISDQQTSHEGRNNTEVAAPFYGYFRQTIRELGWHRDEDNHLVKVAPLEHPEQARDIDLGRRVAMMMHGQDPLNPLQYWLQERVPNALESKMIDARLKSATPPSFLVFIRCPRNAKSPDALDATLASLADLHPGIAPARIVVLGDEAHRTHPALPQLEHNDASSTQTQIEAINACAAGDGSDWLLVVEAGEVFTRAGLLRVALELLDGASDTRALCADEIVRDAGGKLSSQFRPDFNLDMLLSLPACMARHWFYRRKAFIGVGGFDPEFAHAAEFDLLLRLINAGGIAGMEHVHEPLLVIDVPRFAPRQAEQQALARHLKQRGYDNATISVEAPSIYRIGYGHAATPAVSIIIPTKNQLPMLQRCIETLLQKTGYRNYEVLIVDNGSDEADACAWLDGVEAMNSEQLRVLRYPHPFNYSAMNNLAVSQARGEYLVLLNNDTAILREDWLEAMLNHAQRPEVGVVGAKLLYPNGNIQHAGVVLGLRGPAEHPFAGDPMTSPGYLYRAQIDQDYTAVTGACMMVRKEVFDAVGGLDEGDFRVSYNDVDLCLKIRHAGYLVVWTPYALLLHEGSVSQKQEDPAALEAKRLRFVGEQEALYDRWLPVIANDPAYNRNLSLYGKGFNVELERQLTWQPLTWRPLPVTLAVAADQTGCGQYRIIQPTRAIGEAALASSDWSARMYNTVEMERLQPDTLVLQRHMFEEKIEPQERLARFKQCFKVAELDDYLPGVPLKSVHHGALPKDIIKTMRKALTLVDRFVVSTPALAEALSGMHPDTRVVENRLPVHWWGNVRGKRRAGRKPRIGWGGGAGHRGDLELIADVVKALADEVEWVFFGMCPEALRPYVHERPATVPIDAYPARLASLDLDLAVAPLEDNLFNQCKSNLRLLEYGACGFPVVCSDVGPYRGDLPVTRVKPRFRDWMDAIRMHLNDLDASAKAGDELREVVHRDWMLDENYARFWLSQWMPD